MCEPANLSTWGEVLIFMVYNKARHMAYRNAAMKEKAIYSRYRGRNIGCAKDVAKSQGNWDPRHTVGFMKCASFREASLLLESSPLLKQYDFLDNVDIYIMPYNKQDMSHKGYPIIQVFNQHINFKDVYHKSFLPEMEKTVHKFGGVPLVVSQEEPFKWRGIERPGVIIVNQWPSWEVYDRYTASEERKKINELCKTIGNGYEICAELELM